MIGQERHYDEAKVSMRGCAGFALIQENLWQNQLVTSFEY